MLSVLDDFGIDEITEIIMNYMTAAKYWMIPVDLFS